MGKAKSTYGAMGNEPWKEAEIRAIMQEVQTRKSVDTYKLFGGPNGTLPDALSNRTSLEVKECVDHCKGSFDCNICPWVPKCGVPELLAVLASEAAFCRYQNARAGDLDKQHVADTDERIKQETARRDAKRELHAVTAQLETEARLRQAGEKEREQQLDELAACKLRLEKETQRREALEEDLDAFKLKEFDSRRKLDRARLKISAMRGEIIAPTMDALISPELEVDLEKLEDEKIKVAFSIAVGDPVAGDELPTTAATTSTKVKKKNKNANGDVEMYTDDDNNAGDTDDDDGRDDHGHDEDEGDGDDGGDSDAAEAAKKATRASSKSKSGRASNTGKEAGGDDEGDAAAPDDIGVSGTVAASSADSTKPGSLGPGVSMNQSKSATARTPAPPDDAEEIEDARATELRKMRNRVAMHMAEAAEWRRSAEAERRRAGLFARARSRLESDVPAPPPPAPPSARAAAAKARAKRAAAAAVAAEAGGDAAGAAGRRKKRKGTPMRAIPATG